MISIEQSLILSLFSDDSLTDFLCHFIQCSSSSSEIESYFVNLLS